jgi:hypothetical protein
MNSPGRVTRAGTNYKIWGWSLARANAQQQAAQQKAGANGCFECLQRELHDGSI